MMLTLIFIILKLNEVINWEWIWVFCPLWIPLVLVVGIVGIVFLIAWVTTVAVTVKVKLTNRKRK